MNYYTPERISAKATIEMDKDGSVFYVHCPYEIRSLASSAGGKWVQNKKAWMFAFTPSVVEIVEKKFKDNIVISPAFKMMLNRKKQQEQEIMKVREEARKNTPVEFSVEGISLDGKNPFFNYQKHGVICATKASDGFMIGDVVGCGKAEIVDNKIFTPYGRKRIGDVKIGDKVIGSDGKSHNVIGVYPQGVKPVYEVTFNDGYSVKCADEHLWAVYDRLNNSYNILTVNELIDKNLVKEKTGVGVNVDKIYKYKTYYKKINGRNKWRIPIVKPIEFENKNNLPIDPYLLGVMIGDGSFSTHTVTVYENSVDFDEMFSKYIENNYFKARELSKPKKSNARIVAFSVKNELRNLGLDGKRSCEKFIPICYKYSSVDDRLQLLQGMMDTDGHCRKSTKNVFNGTEFSTTSEILANDVAEIVQSLGGIVRVSAKIPFYTKDGVRIYCKKTYRLNIKLPPQFNPFKLKRKAEAYHAPQKYEVSRLIKDISYVGEKECVCIAVDAPDHLYVTEHCIVTHNTIQALGTAVHRKLNGEVNNCLIVCPASLKYNWESEIKKFTKESVLVINGTKEEREKQWIAEGYFFKIANYECVMNDLYYEIDKKKKRQRPDNRISCADFILNNYFSMIVCDEVHYLKSHDAFRTRAIKKFKCKYRLGLTGTPIDGRLEELHSIFEFIKPGLFPSKSRFIEKYAITDYWGAIKGYKNIDEVKSKILPFYVRRLKEDVLNDLPEKIFIDLHVELEDKVLKEYKKIASRKHEITEEKAAIEAIIRCRQFCDFPELLDLRHASAKFAMLYDLLKELVFDNGEKVIIFTQYKESLDLLKRNLEDEFDLSFIYGEIPSKERFEIVKDFKSNPKRQVLIMTDAGAEGLNLQEANNLIHYNDNYSPAKMIQRNGRVDRIGQKRVVRIYRFICKDTIEERVRELLEKKQTVNNSILDENNSELSLAQTSTMDILGCL